jgi:hypothetical protein
MVCLIPNLRSCGNFSLGFPTVAYASSTQDTVDFRFFNLAINDGFVSLITLGFFFLYKRIRNDRTRRLVRSGFSFLGLYQLLIVFGYAVIYPVLIIFGENHIIGMGGIVYAYFIHPFFGIIQEVANLFPADVQTSFLFGDNYDMPMRIGYVLMCGAWFGLGVLKAVIFKGKKAEAGQSAPAGYPVDLP